MLLELIRIVSNKGSIELAITEILNTGLKECAQEATVLFDAVLTKAALSWNTDMIEMFWWGASLDKRVIDLLIWWVLSVVEFDWVLRVDHVFGNK